MAFVKHATTPSNSDLENHSYHLQEAHYHRDQATLAYKEAQIEMELAHRHIQWAHESSKDLLVG